MKVRDIMKVLEKDMKVAVFSTVDENNEPHGRHIHIGVADEQGVFFMTNPKTDFYKQLSNNPYVALTGFHEEGYLVQVVRMRGKVRKVGREKLQELLDNNPYVDRVYPEESERQTVQVFQLYEAEGFYHSLSQGHKYTFEIGK